MYRQVFFSKFRIILKDSIKIDLKGKEYERVKWTQLAQRKTLVNTITYLVS
jgi:hypothetical protein